MKSDAEFLKEYVTDTYAFDLGLGVRPRSSDDMQIIRLALLDGEPLPNTFACDLSFLADVRRMVRELHVLSRSRNLISLFQYNALLDKMFEPDKFNRMISIMEVQSSLKKLIEQVKTGTA